MPAMKMVMPRSRISQWKPAGFRRGNSVPWAMREDTRRERVNIVFNLRGGGLNTKRAMLTIMVKPKQNGQNNTKRKRYEDVFGTDVPRIYKPTSVGSWEKSFAGGESQEVDVCHLTNVNEAGEEDDSQWGAIVFNELANIAMEQGAFANETSEPCHNQDE